MKDFAYKLAEKQLNVVKQLKNNSMLTDTTYLGTNKTAMKTTADNVVSGCSTDYKKCDALYQWVMEHMTYVENTAENEAVDVYSTRKGVCFGYANLLTAMLRLEGIPAVTITGGVFNKGNYFTYEPSDYYSGSDMGAHAWTLCYFDGKWHYLDPTWDDQFTTRNWFDLTIEQMALSRTHLKLYDTFTYGTYLVTYDNAQLAVSGYLGSATAIALPSEIYGQKVETTGWYGFNGSMYSDKNNTSIKTVVIPESTDFSTLGIGAFQNYKSLETVVVPHTVKNIDAGVLLNCGSQLTVYCTSGSAMETYAKNNNLNYVIYQDNYYLRYNTITEGKSTYNGWVADGVLSGTEGVGKKITKLKVESIVYGSVYVSAYIKGAWTEYATNEEISGNGSDIEAVRMQLTGTLSEYYEIYYRTHNRHKGWLGWTKEKGISGTMNIGGAIEGIQIKLVPKGSSVAGITDDTNVSYVGAEATATPKPTNTPTPKPTNTPTPRPTNTPTPRPTNTSTPRPTNTATPKPTNTATPKPTNTVTPKPTNTATPKPTNTATPKPTNTVTPKPTNTVTPKPTNTVTAKPTNTVTAKPTNTVTPKLTNTVTPKPTKTVTPKPTSTVTPEPTKTPEPTPFVDENKVIIHCYQESGVPKVRYTKIEDGEELTGLCRMENEGEGWYQYVFENTSQINFELIVDGEELSLWLQTGEYWYYNGLYDERPEIYENMPTSKPTNTPTPINIPTSKPTNTPTPINTPTNSITPIPEPTDEPVVTEGLGNEITLQPTKQAEKLQIASMEVSHSGKKAHVGDKITIKAVGKGGSGILKYQFSYKYKGTTVLLNDYSTKNSVVFKPKKAGTYILNVRVMDEKGQTAVRTEKSYKVLEKYSIDTLKVSGKDKKLKIKVNAVGAEGTVKYKYEVKYKGKLVKKNDYGTKKSYTVKVKKKGTYSITVYAKDTETQKVKKKTVKYKMK